MPDIIPQLAQTIMLQTLFGLTGCLVQQCERAQFRLIGTECKRIETIPDQFYKLLATIPELVGASPRH